MPYPLKDAKAKSIPVISYDRLITGTDAVTYYVSFDNQQVCKIQGQYLIDKLKPTVDDPKNIEIFYGSLDDKNDLFFYEEAMQILKPYIDSGALVVKSGKIFTLKKKGYTPSNIPVITGQDATAEALQNVKEGYQAMTIYKSRDDLHDAVIDIVRSISSGKKANINDTTTYNNGVKDMDSFPCTPELIDRSNLAKLL